MTQLSGIDLASRGKGRRERERRWEKSCSVMRSSRAKGEGDTSQDMSESSPGWRRWCISRCIRSEKPSPSSSLSTGDSRPMSQSLSPASLSPRPLSFRLNLSMSCNAYLCGLDYTHIFINQSQIIQRCVCITMLQVHILQIQSCLLFGRLIESVLRRD